MSVVVSSLLRVASVFDENKTLNGNVADNDLSGCGVGQCRVLIVAHVHLYLNFENVHIRTYMLLLRHVFCVGSVISVYYS